MATLSNGFQLKPSLLHQLGVGGCRATTPYCLKALSAVREPSPEVETFSLIYATFQTMWVLVARGDTSLKWSVRLQDGSAVSAC